MEPSVRKNDAHRLITTLAEQQLSDGSFEVTERSGRSQIPQAARLSVHATLLDLLMQNSQVRSHEVTYRLAHYLAHELFDNVFADTLRTSNTGAVFHALAALHAYNTSLVPPQAIAQAIRFLTAHELSLGGPYVNMLAQPGKADRDTNRSIGRFLYHLGGPFPVLVRYVSRSKVSHFFVTPWAAALQQELFAHAVDPQSEAAMPDYPVKSSEIEYFYHDYYAAEAGFYGSPAIVPARLLLHYAVPAREQVVSQPVNQEAILLCAQRVLPLRGANKILKRIIAADRHNEIGPFAIRLADTLKDKRPPSQTLELLGAANLLNWTAYTIYDDIIDEESNGELLPLANMALRGSVRLFKEAVADRGFEELVNLHFDAVDTANAWELAHCRFKITPKTIQIGLLPDYGNLGHVYERSLTHRLPLLATLTAVGQGRADETEMLAEAFAQYLTVRQLSDDLHDWRADLQRGHVSYVVARLLEDAQITMGFHQFSKLMPKLETTFLHMTLPVVASKLLGIAREAQTAIRSSTVIETPNILSELIASYEKSMHDMYNEYHRGLALLDVFPRPSIST